PPALVALHLPAFPTRRSSDLISLTVGWRRICNGSASAFQLIRPSCWKEASHPCIGQIPQRCRKILAFWTMSAKWSSGGLYTPWRSEEHTSELQSRFDLVCRRL